MAVLLAAYVLWTPGNDITDGRHDLGRNGIWLQHGWLGDDKWFQDNSKTDQIPRFRNAENLRELAAKLRQNHFTDIYPHLCPASETDGRIPHVDDAQADKFFQEFQGFRVMPWIGGVAGVSARPGDLKWKSGFIASVKDLFAAHPQFAGVHINVEPLRSGDTNYLKFLAELRAALPAGKILSVAAYPPPTRWHPYPDVHWDEQYFRQVAAQVDQLVVMMYDTSLKNSKLYQSLMASWTKEVLEWSGDKPVLLGLPAYDDAGVGYHDPRVENLTHGLLGIHRGLASFKALPSNYQGIAIYSEWEMRDADWTHIQEHFLKR